MTAGPATAAAGAAAWGAWRAYHLYYHADQDRLLVELVRPLVEGLLADGLVDRFYFVRYNLGGPHVRLRWRALGDPDSAERRLAESAGEFFARVPSTASLPVETVRKLNRTLLRIDPLARPEDDRVHPDNSWRAFPALFEVDRYGGAERFDASLALFTASSIRALELVVELRSLSEGRAQGRFLRLLVQLAAGLARDDRELRELAGYGVRFMGSAFEPVAERADEVFAASGDGLVRQLAGALEPSAVAAEPLAAAVRRFAPALDELPAKKRWRVAASHLHMTANRLGLLNAHEVYLSRLAERAVERWAAEGKRVRT